MHFQACLLAVTAGFAVAQDIQRRGFSFRAPRVDEDVPSPPPAYRPAYDAPYGGSSVPRLGEGPAQEASPQYLPASRPNDCLRKECAELTAEVANQVIENMLENLGGPSSTTTSPRPWGTQIRPPVLTAYATASPMPNFNVARTMTLAQEDLALFNQEEQDMYFNDRMCFYANVERKYASVATASPAPTRIAGRDIFSEINSMSTTRLATDDASSYQYDLWNTWMPYNILSIYEQVAGNGSMTIATTTCSGLGDSPSLTLSYVEARATNQSPTPTSNDHMVEGAANTQAKAGRSAIFGAVVALSGLIAL